MLDPLVKFKSWEYLLRVSGIQTNRGKIAYALRGGLDDLRPQLSDEEYTALAQALEEHEEILVLLQEARAKLPQAKANGLRGWLLQAAQNPDKTLQLILENRAPENGQAPRLPKSGEEKDRKNHSPSGPRPRTPYPTIKTRGPQDTLHTEVPSEVGKGCIDVAQKHVSIRRYLPVEIPEEHVRLMMEAARRAPTDAALHLWTAVRVRDREKRARIAEAIKQPHVAQASEFFVFLADLHRLERLLEHRGETLGMADCSLLVFAAIDAGIAAENLALAAESLGYGICFIGAVWNAPRLIIEELGLPRRTLPLFGLAVGVPEESPPRRPRYPLDTLFHVDKYREYTAEDLNRIYREMAPITRRRDYLRLARRYAGRGGYFEERNKLVLELAAEQGFKACEELL